MTLERILFYGNVGLNWLAILFYIFAAWFGFKYLSGLSEGSELGSKSFGLVMAGGLLMLAASVVNIAFNLSRNQHWWDPILIVNAVDIFLNAACLHTIHWRMSRRWTAWLSVATILVDANLRFIILFFF